MKRSWYATPYALWMLMFTVVPLLFVCYYAFTTKTGDFTTANIVKICYCSVPYKFRRDIGKRGSFTNTFPITLARFATRYNLFKSIHGKIIVCF